MVAADDECENSKAGIHQASSLAPGLRNGRNVRFSPCVDSDENHSALPPSHHLSKNDKCEKSDHLSSKDENGSFGTSEESKTEDSDSELNSYKFPRPRVYVKNCYKSENVPVSTTLNDISVNVGSKPRLPDYEKYIDSQLQHSQPSKKKIRGIKEDELKSVECLNAEHLTSPLRLANFSVKNVPIKALVDTGSTHCLLSVATYEKLTGVTFTKLSVDMKVAGGVLKDNVKGATQLVVTFLSNQGVVEIPITFLIANQINGYEAILGGTLLFEEGGSVSSDHLTLPESCGGQKVPLEKAPLKRVQGNTLICDNVHISRGVTKVVTARVERPLTCAQGTWLKGESWHDSLDILSCIQTSPDTVQCTVKNRTRDDVTLDSSILLGQVHDQGHEGQTSGTIVNSMDSHLAETPEKEPEELSIDEQIIAEHQLFDPSDLDQRYSYKDCEVNPNLDPETRAKLDQILFEYQDVFAKSKLDVGEFKEFEVKLDIAADIPAEKQRFMSEEKLTYCKRTFQEFEKLGLVEEVHSPKTISNLLLVPKYEGLRDLTKASVYLAQVKGEKNTSFRIVQDLRRINAKTRNIKRSLPKLPEAIFQKLKNKVVSSIDANQAYWHLKLHPQSRPYTAFYVQNRTLQFCRMPQGLASAPACWDEAMSRIFSSKTLEKVKATLSPAEAAEVPDSYEDFFTFFQDDSWIFTDPTADNHLSCLKAVLGAYKMHDIKLSPKKSSFFPETFKILGVSMSPLTAELSLSQVKAQSILEWEKPDSLYTLQSRLYALNYWMKFIPALAELKFPLQQIVRSQIFSWNEAADLAWQRIKAVIALDIKLTVPERDEQLILTTDASKVACSCILWVHRKESLRVVGCYSKLFSHTDSLKSIHFKETYALVLAFDHFKPYLLNTQKSVIVFTDARALMWVGRNREYSIACNGLVNKLAKIQLEIPHVVYSVPSEVNFLADVFSRAFSSSRFLDKEEFTLSKPQANSLPPLTEPFVASEEALYRYFALPLNSEKSDLYPRRKPKVPTPRPISNLYKLFQGCTPEEKYLSALRLLKGWDDSSIEDAVSTECNSLQTHSCATPLGEESSTPDPVKVMEVKRIDLHKLLMDRAVKQALDQMYSGLDTEMRGKMENTLRENGKQVLQQRAHDVIRNDFMTFEVMKDWLSKDTASLSDDKEVSIGYYVIQPLGFHPKKDDVSHGIVIPIQKDVVIPPQGHLVVDTGVQLVIPTNLCARFVPHSVSSQLRIYSHSGPVEGKLSSTLKLTLHNQSDSEVRMTAGTFVVKALIHPTIHPTLNFENGTSRFPKGKLEKRDEPHCNSVRVETDSSLQKEVDDSEPDEDELTVSQISSLYGSIGRNTEVKNFKLTGLPTSYLHMMMDEQFPTSINLQEIGTAVLLPRDDKYQQSIIKSISEMESQMMNSEAECNTSLIYHPCPDPEAVIQDFTQRMRELSVQTQTDLTGEDQSCFEKAKDWARDDMCKKLAVISVDLLKNQIITRTMLAQTQQGDDYLGPLRDRVAEKDKSFPIPNFFIKDQVLYKKCMSKDSMEDRHVICLPDVLLPSVIHSLHVSLGHSSFTVTKRNFEHYYYNRNATRTIKSYVQACVTCALAHKFDIHKGTPSTKRSLEPTRPRQYIYCDLIPMNKGSMSYMLFCLDAYSQFVYALPMKDKTSNSILQVLSCLFATTGWPEAIYLDNETSFQKAAKQLVKVAPVKVLYSVPYCQFQNWSENSIKSFKKVLLKTLHDSEHTHANEEWHLLLPTVTQSLNRQVLPGTGMTRESVHYNMVTHFHPLANLSSEAVEEMNREVNPPVANWFKIRLEKRKRQRVGSKKSQTPEFQETQIVFMRDQTPSVSSILKCPNKGPYRIEKLEEKNVVLTDLATGKSVHSHVQLIRPVDMTELRLILSKNWDLNVHLQKAGQAVTHPGIFDAPSHPVSMETVIETEKERNTLPEEGELEDLFHSHDSEPKGTEPPPPDENVVPHAPRPPDIDLYGPPKTNRRSQRLSKESENDLMSAETDFNSKEVEILSPENDLGEQTFLGIAQNIHLEVSKLYQEKLATAESENDKSFSPLGETEGDPPCTRPVLKPVRMISFSLPAQPILCYPEKG